MNQSSSPLPALCRDCGLDPGRHPEFGPRCVHCGSPRLLRHAELHDLSIAHIDCDAFYASVEKRDRPELRDQPVIVGGRQRGVVAAACYVARLYGVRSAMPIFMALKRCPHAVIIPPDMAKYSAAGRAVRALMQAVTPLVEPVSIDEAFLDLSEGTDHEYLSPALRLIAFAQRVESDLGLTVSVGLSYNKFLAKIASDLDKPRGFAVIGEAEAPAFLADKPVGLIWGVGNVLQRRLAADGIHTIGQLAQRDPMDLAKRYGSIGPRLHEFAHGQDRRAVVTEHSYRSISVETTLPSNSGDLDDLAPVLARLCEQLQGRLHRADFGTQGIVLKVKTADFRQITRHRRLVSPSANSAKLFDAALSLLQTLADGTLFRLIGVGADGLVPLTEADAPDLLS